MAIEHISEWGEAAFGSPATGDDLLSLELEIGHAVPSELRDLLSETNGIVGEFGLGLVWTAERIAHDNREFRRNPEFRELYMPFDGLLFFADAGNGDQFGISLSGNNEIYVWDHENDSRRWVAASVLGYLEGWMTGRLTV